MGIKSPFICEIAPDTYAINEFGLSAMYLLVGAERALLIDTCCGVCDLQKVVSGLTDLPLQVVLTHGHLDHVGGMGCFDQIYLHEKDWDLARDVKREELQNYVDAFGKAGGYQLYEYTAEDVRDYTRIPEFLPLMDGMVFDLGGRKVEAYEIPGHTAGSVTFLDVNNRIMFSGDCCNVNLLAQNSSISETLQGLGKFKSFSARFDQNFNGHVGYAGRTECLSQPKRVADDLIHICEAVIAGDGVPQPYEFLGHTLYKMSYGCAGLSYDPEKI